MGRGVQQPVYKIKEIIQLLNNYIKSHENWRNPNQNEDNKAIYSMFLKKQTNNLTPILYPVKQSAHFPFPPIFNGLKGLKIYVCFIDYIFFFFFLQIYSFSLAMPCSVRGRSTLRDPICCFLPLCAVSQGLSVPYQFLENRNEQSCMHFSGLRSWERAPAWITFSDFLQ